VIHGLRGCVSHPTETTQQIVRLKPNQPLESESQRLAGDLCGSRKEPFALRIRFDQLSSYSVNPEASEQLSPTALLYASRTPAKVVK
jgi:hypothetical protein